MGDVCRKAGNDRADYDVTNQLIFASVFWSKQIIIFDNDVVKW